MVEMSEPEKTCDPPWDDFQEGTVNGAYWYIIKGGMAVREGLKKKGLENSHVPVPAQL